jgi:hypothetical protein
MTLKLTKEQFQGYYRCITPDGKDHISLCTEFVRMVTKSHNAFRLAKHEINITLHRSLPKVKPKNMAAIKINGRTSDAQVMAQRKTKEFRVFWYVTVWAKKRRLTGHWFWISIEEIES